MSHTMEFQLLSTCRVFKKSIHKTLKKHYIMKKYPISTIRVLSSLKFHFLFQLALIQTKHVISRMQKLYPNKKFEIRK